MPKKYKFTICCGIGAVGSQYALGFSFKSGGIPVMNVYWYYLARSQG
jgi:hypothetical protein